MNLKEAFRYQSFLNSMMSQAASTITHRDHAYKVTKIHKRSSANPEAEDFVEEVDFGQFPKNDDVLALMEFLIEQKENLTTAINKAKLSCGIDIDACVETNKMRQKLYSCVQSMLSYNPVSSLHMEKGEDYRFNVAGDQTRYYYDIQRTYELNYDADHAKWAMRKAIHDADICSAEIDSAMVNTNVDYIATFDVNDSFQDVVDEYSNMRSLTSN